MGDSPAVDVATGITIGWAVNGFTAHKVNVSGPDISVEDIDVTHQGSSNALEYKPADLIDNGELSFGFHFNPDTTPPVGVEDTITVTWPSGCTWAFEGYMKSYTPDAPLNDAMTGDAVIKVSGEITRDASGASGASGSGSS